MGAFSADGWFVNENGIPRISMTRPWFGPFLESIERASNGLFRIVPVKEDSKDSSKRMIALEMAPPTDNALRKNPEVMKFAAWLYGTFGGPGCKSKGFNVYPAAIRSWSKELQQIYALGYYIGDGSFTISSRKNSEKPNSYIRLFCKPKATPTNYYHAAYALIINVLDPNHIPPDTSSSTNYYGGGYQVLDSLKVAWEVASQRHKLVGCYKSDVLELIHFLQNYKYEQSINEIFNPLIETNFSQKPDDINEITALALKDVEAYTNGQKQCQSRRRVPTHYFDPEHRNHGDHNGSKEEALCFKKKFKNAIGGIKR
ncbi:hypothetical protein D1115_10790 [Vibrio alfacsensis]|uniref:Uncharacterized protein n=1 Tax=Vibrio alfacsensis TaxID=1074311 RepID=A0ABM6YV39_9VIBR|nr:hypothetical protein D1115_10790 [Vibrio alfacsensis]